MPYRSLLAKSACVCAFTVAPFGGANAGALSDQLSNGLTNASIVLSGDYANFDSNRRGNANSYGTSGAVTIPLDVYNSHIELDGGYHHLSGNRKNLDQWNTAGSLYWTPGEGKLGATVGYHGFGSDGAGDVTNYGAFAEWWANDHLTLAAKGGGFSGNRVAEGYYAGGAATGYLQPDIGLTASVDHTHINRFANETDYTASGEWLVSEELPVSVYAGYTHSTYSDNLGHDNVVFAGLRIYIDGDGVTTLIDRHRSGTLGWDSSFSPAAFRYRY